MRFWSTLIQKRQIEVTHSGYTAKKYGTSSVSIRNPQGKEIFHTGFSSVKTEKELKKLLIEIIKNYENNLWK